MGFNSVFKGLIWISEVLLYFFLQTVQIGSEFHAASYCIGTKKLSRRVKVAGREAEYISVQGRSY